MSDVNVSVVAIDSAMDCFEKIGESASNYQKVVQYDISELKSSISYKVHLIRLEIETLYDRLSYLDEDEDEERERILSDIQDLKRKLTKLETLYRKTEQIESNYSNESNAIVSSVSVNVANGLRTMATYLREISNVDAVYENSIASGSSNIYTGESNYCVVVIDSTKYPESAEHIRSAIKQGHPAMLTLNRTGADENRKQSLSGIPISPIYDRDEYPPAAFAEGGTGAHVAYINPSDNQGSGSSFRWQLNGIPDGTRVRFRVI